MFCMCYSMNEKRVHRLRKMWSLNGPHRLLVRGLCEELCQCDFRLDQRMLAIEKNCNASSESVLVYYLCQNIVTELLPNFLCKVYKENHPAREEERLL